jgi:hypothetical protein
MPLPAVLPTRRAARPWMIVCCVALASTTGCATTKTSDTSRTGIEQLLISSATDQALDKVNFESIRGAKVFVETKYLDCTDKNYIIVAVHQRLLAHGSTLVDKPEEAQVILEVGSGGVGTDRHEFFVGIPAIPLAPPSPVMIPKTELFNRSKGMGTAKLIIVAYDAKTRQPVINAGSALARADYKQWNVMGSVPAATGRVPAELKAATGESEAFVPVPNVAGRSKSAFR